MTDSIPVNCRILIADDHEVVRSGLRALLSERQHWEVVAEAADGKEAVAQTLATTPDIAIVDYSLPILNGVEVTRQIRHRSPSTEVLIFTMYDRHNLIGDLLRAGLPSQIRCRTFARDGHRDRCATPAILHRQGF
jgi:DNA-binding NarL/FixJ family response regulator